MAHTADYVTGQVPSTVALFLPVLGWYGDDALSPVAIEPGREAGTALKDAPASAGRALPGLTGPDSCSALLLVSPGGGGA